jgi:hypothetical protein
MAKAVRSGRETGVYNCNHSFLNMLEENVDDDHGIISTASGLDSYNGDAHICPITHLDPHFHKFRSFFNVGYPQ